MVLYGLPCILSWSTAHPCVHISHPMPIPTAHTATQGRGIRRRQRSAQLRAEKEQREHDLRQGYELARYVAVTFDGHFSDRQSREVHYHAMAALLPKATQSASCLTGITPSRKPTANSFSGRPAFATTWDSTRPLWRPVGMRTRFSPRRIARGCSRRMIRTCGKTSSARWGLSTFALTSLSLPGLALPGS